jgi:hypothetical protein
MIYIIVSNFAQIVSTPTVMTTQREMLKKPVTAVYICQYLYFPQPKCQGPTNVITVRETPLYGHAPTYQLSLTYLERQNCYCPDNKILFKKQLFDLEVKGQGPTKVITVRDTPPNGHAYTNYRSMNSFVRSMIFRMWVHDHKAVCTEP